MLQQVNLHRYDAKDNGVKNIGKKKQNVERNSLKQLKEVNADPKPINRNFHFFIHKKVPFTSTEFMILPMLLAQNPPSSIKII